MSGVKADNPAQTRTSLYAPQRFLQTLRLQKEDYHKFTMSEHENDMLIFQPEQYDRDKLNQNVRELQGLVRAKNTELAALRLRLAESRLTVALQERDGETSKVDRRNREQPVAFSSIQDGEARQCYFRPVKSQKWIRAQEEHPEDISYPHKRYPLVLVYEPGKELFYDSRVDLLPGKAITLSRICQASRVVTSVL